ncbi:MAG: YebC/PmpR family DNA-binding transcriptional regulator, partial [Anaerolineae bacterium]
KGYIAIAPNGEDPDAIFDVAVEAGAEDFVFSDDMIEVFAAPQDFQQVIEALEANGIKSESSELSMIPKNTLELSEQETMRVMHVITALEDLDDVQQIYSNLDISDEVMDKFEEEE